MICTECGTEFDIDYEGATTSDGKELCLDCQDEYRDYYDENWNLKRRDADAAGDVE